MPGPAAQSSLVRLLVAAAFLTFFAGLSPHLVHHLFEPESAAEECPFAAAGERAQPVVEPAVSLTAPVAPVAAVAPPAAPALAAGETGAPAVRAPPA